MQNPPTFRKLTVFGREFLVTGEFTDLQVTRFLSHVRFDKSGCWIWTGFINPSGYGSATCNSRTYVAHRLSYEMFVGPIPPGKHLHHKTEEPTCCKGPVCANWDHLKPLTPDEHTHDFQPNSIIRFGATRCTKGHELSGENLYVNPRTGKRRCVACLNDWQRRRWAVKHPPKPKVERTHCGNGHQFTPENTYMYRGKKLCRACHNQVTLRRYHEKKGAT